MGAARFAAYRDLAVTLIGRELVVRYKRSVLGVLWALIEPLANVAVYVVVFGVLLGAGTETRDYAVFALWGVLPYFRRSRYHSKASRGRWCSSRRRSSSARS